MYNSITTQATTNMPSITFRVVGSITPLFTDKFQELKKSFDAKVTDFEKDILALALDYARLRPEDIDIPEDYPQLVDPGYSPTGEPVVTFSKDIVAIISDADGEEHSYSLDFEEDYDEFAILAKNLNIYSDEQIYKIAKLLRIEYSQANSSSQN